MTRLKLACTPASHYAGLSVGRHRLHNAGETPWP